ncbi:MAG TPA: class I SAM-dependent methyltransferase [Phycisphaerales bacterium]|nr:class I SAM-dependent methyltransferase [Phycisphaerales bacterium]
MDRHDCYEVCVQSPRHVSAFLHAVHGNQPVVLREDFCGTAALSRQWIEDGRSAGAKRRAIGIDLDAEVLARAAQENERAGMDVDIRLVRGDLRERMAGAGSERGGCDVAFAGNFSSGYLHDRATLMGYLRGVRGAMNTGGVFVCDTYTGPGVFKEGAVTRVHPGRGHETVRYTWEQRDADALMAMVTNVLHFQVEVDGEVVARYPEAFVYRWRLWSIPELREAMREAGFGATNVYQDVGSAAEPMGHGRELREAGIVCVVGRVGTN